MSDVMLEEEKMKSNSAAIIKCKKCGSIFQPDAKTKAAWTCPRCDAKNPNLKRHYRSVADLYVLGLIIMTIMVVVGFNEAGLTLGVILSAADAVLLAATIVFVYKSNAPWSDAAAKTLIWIVFGVALFFNVVIPMVFVAKLNIPALMIYALVSPYLFWLNSQATKCTAQN